MCLLLSLQLFELKSWRPVDKMGLLIQSSVYTRAAMSFMCTKVD